MGWEKHDNEIRTALQNGTGFLPEEESWDVNAAWQKMQRLKQNEENASLVQPLSQSLTVATTNPTIRWWHAAAALLLLLGAGIVWKAKLPPSSRPYAPVARFTPPAVVPAETNANKGQFALEETISEPTKRAKDTEDKPLRNLAIKSIPTPQAADASPLPATTQNTPTPIATVPANETTELASSQGITHANEPLPMTPMPTKDSATASHPVKIRPGIVHLNELGLDGVPPPGFTPRKRYDAKATIAHQSSIQETMTRPLTRKNGLTIPL